MKKNIAIICEYILIPDRIGGMDRFFKAYDIILKQKGFEVTWFFKDVVEFDFYKKVSIISANNGAIESFFLNHCAANDLKFDIVITHFFQAITPFYKRIKNVMDTTIISVDHNSRPIDGFPFLKKIKNKVKGLLYGKYVDKIVGVSNYSKKEILNDFGTFLKNKTTVIHNGIDTSIFKNQQIDKIEFPIKLISVAYLQESKGIHNLIEALSKLDVKNQNKISLDIYGVGPYKSVLEDLINKYQLDNIITFKGNSSILNETYCQYHYFVLPTYMECFSLSILESLASNIPVITTTVGGNTEIIEEGINGFLFEPKDASALAEIITNIVSCKIAITNNVSSKIENEFTLDIMVANHLKLLECI